VANYVISASAQPLSFHTSTMSAPSFLQRYSTALSVALIAASVIVFFADALFTGKNFLAESDNVAFYSFIPYLNDAKQDGEFPLWVPYIFSGMPSLASFLAAGDRSWDVLSKALFAIPRFFGEGTGNDTWRLALWYAIYGCGVYLLMRQKKHDHLVGVLSGIGAIFSTFVIVWVMIGHSTKPVSLATFPFILLALERIRERFSLLNLFLLILPLIVLVSATHPQMMFYIGCGTLIYLLVELVSRMITKTEPMAVLRAGGALALAGTLAVATHADMFLATREYTPNSTRGSAPLVQSPGAVDQSGGNDYEYATNWSFSKSEVATFFVPNYFGFGKMKNERGQMTMPYWGQMPFTDAANYMGIGLLLLAALGAWNYRKDPFVLFLVVMGAFSLLLSFGKNMPLLYDLFYNVVPGFNKFRAPSMALCLLQFAVPVLAGYGASVLIAWAAKSNAATRRMAMYVGGAAAAFFLIGMVGPSIIETGYRQDVAQAIVAKNPDQIQSADQIPRQYIDSIYTNMASDWRTTAMMALLFGVVVFLAGRGTLKPALILPVLLILTVTDLWRVAKRPYEPSKNNVEKTVFRRTDVVDFLKSDPGMYRIADFSRTPPNAWAYHFIEHVHGYSSAKLRVYQDMLDIAAPGKGQEPAPGNSRIINPFVWDLLNVKYLVADQPLFPGQQPVFTSQQTGQMVFTNPGVLPRAWFVDSVGVEPNRRALAEMLRDGTFNPRSVAMLDAPLTTAVQPGSGASARVTARTNQSLSLAVEATGNAFLVVSEVFYPEWQASIDGKPVTTHRTNFLLRGIEVPPGKHTLTFTFVSNGFQTGRTVSMAANGIAILIGIGGVLMHRRRKAVA
jgi:hypothetical protein